MSGEQEWRVAEAFDAMLDADAAYQAAFAANRAFHESPEGRALTEHFLASGGWISTYPDQDVILRHQAHEENRSRELDRVIHAFHDKFGLK